MASWGAYWRQYGLYATTKASPRTRRRPRSGEWARRRERIYARDGRRCVACGTTEGLTLDHIVPVSRGGTSGLDNLQTMCRACNGEKGSEQPEQQRQQDHEQDQDDQ